MNHDSIELDVETRELQYISTANMEHVQASRESLVAIR
jgi:hypothetical protein